MKKNMIFCCLRLQEGFIFFYFLTFQKTEILTQELVFPKMFPKKSKKDHVLKSEKNTNSLKGGGLLSKRMYYNFLTYTY